MGTFSTTDSEQRALDQESGRQEDAHQRARERRSYLCLTCEVTTAPMTEAEAAAQRATGHALQDPNATRCADCGEWGETTGHQSCQYPQDHP